MEAGASIDKADNWLDLPRSKRTRITVEGFYKTYDHYPVSLLDSVCLANKGTDYVAVGDEPVKPGHAPGGDPGWSYASPAPGLCGPAGSV